MAMAMAMAFLWLGGEMVVFCGIPLLRGKGKAF
jgi:hypothetical protein